MKSSLNAVRGMNDILPAEVGYWQYIERKLRSLAASYGYKEIRLPIVEHTELYKRGVGEVTDIVEKEMYTFSDRNGESLSLRPEGTAGVVRAGIEHSLFYGENPKVWYLGPMFRHERPQKGRYRQFYQFGLESFGCASAYVDIEILAFCNRLWRELDLAHKIKLQINCLGTAEVRFKHKQELIAYFSANLDKLDDDSKNRLNRNPLRILDSKNPDLKQIISDAPKLTDYLDEASKAHMDILETGLKNLNIDYEVNPYLVRGLDYYCLTVFEWVTNDLGSQGTVCGGGRYDSLVKQMGGDHTPAVGMSIGMERLVLMVSEQLTQNNWLNNNPDCYLILFTEPGLNHGLVLAEQLRDKIPGLKITMNSSGLGLKNQFKKADKSGAKLAIIIGEEETRDKIYTIKWLRKEKAQEKLALNDLINLLNLLNRN
ncbi:MAG: histidine--tRNA ligase [Gammaproteobacteria bacterium]|nr:histidine--tRNA ligase [Gammaproteobacteria bacterium]